MSEHAPIITRHTITTKSTKMELSGLALRDLLRAAGHSIPDDVRIYFSVPRGGDYSGCDVEIGNENPVRVFFTTRSES